MAERPWESIGKSLLSPFTVVLFLVIEIPLNIQIKQRGPKWEGGEEISWNEPEKGTEMEFGSIIRFTRGESVCVCVCIHAHTCLQTLMPACIWARI